ncbi:hypothetical protein VB620_14270 [Nodularia harveyana UHCC-0300]|uniref:Uncharacterized protein n=1 Tax=Nodularia harveyana UHCC-0300 TaxID=2974287 RepID=A0ABU5UHP1_9CYAN|nr:hypothetical protein [Nodularia harveyana]MEA5582501.1 hypothetical protein [Nodularia harveyana UHCC-0300]
MIANDRHFMREIAVVTVYQWRRRSPLSSMNNSANFLPISHR